MDCSGGLRVDTLTTDPVRGGVFTSHVNDLAMTCRLADES